MKRQGSLGEPVSMTELAGFLIRAEALAVRPYRFSRTTGKPLLFDRMSGTGLGAAEATL